MRFAKTGHQRCSTAISMIGMDSAVDQLKGPIGYDCTASPPPISGEQAALDQGIACIDAATSSSPVSGYGGISHDHRTIVEYSTAGAPVFIANLVDPVGLDDYFVQGEFMIALNAPATCSRYTVVPDHHIVQGQGVSGADSPTAQITI
jgi:hypothetical protein